MDFFNLARNLGAVMHEGSAVHSLGGGGSHHEGGYPLQGRKRTPRSEKKLRTTPWTTWRDKFNERGGPTFHGQPFATRIGRGVSEGRSAFRVFDLFANAAGARGHP